MALCYPIESWLCSAKLQFAYPFFAPKLKDDNEWSLLIHGTSFSWIGIIARLPSFFLFWKAELWRNVEFHPYALWFVRSCVNSLRRITKCWTLVVLPKTAKSTSHGLLTWVRGLKRDPTSASLLTNSNITPTIYLQAPLVKIFSSDSSRQWPASSIFRKVLLGPQHHVVVF